MAQVKWTKFKVEDRVYLDQWPNQVGTITKIYNSGTCVVLWENNNEEREEDPEYLFLLTKEVDNRFWRH